MFTLRSGLLLYFSLKTNSSICHNVLDIRIIFAAHCEHLRARADATSINQALLKLGLGTETRYQYGTGTHVTGMY